MVKVYSTVLQYLRDTFPAPFYLKTDKYEVGTVLFTANPYLRTNATIIKVLIENSMYQVLTDIGNIIDVCLEDLKKYYLPPVCKRTDKSPSTDDSNYFLLKEHLGFKYEQ